MSFLSLPPEIILQIGQYLGRDLCNLNSLLRVNWRLAILLTPILLDAACDLHCTRQGAKALYSVIERGDEAAVQRLVKKGILRLASEGRLLNDAIETQSGRVVQKLLECGVDAGGIASDGQTPLFVAARVGNAPVIQLLLSRAEIEVNTPDTLGRAPLLIAATNGHEEAVRLLLSDPKVSVDTAEGSARTALTMAAMNGHEKVVRMLLDHPGINVNVQTQYGDTPLNWAAVNGHVSVVRMLVEDERVDINLENHSSLTPLRSATECSQQGVVRLLLAREGIDICKSNPAINRRKHEWALARKLETRERRKNHRGWARKLPAWVKGWWGRMGKEDESRERECIYYSTSPGESTFDLR